MKTISLALAAGAFLVLHSVNAGAASAPAGGEPGFRIKTEFEMSNGTKSVKAANESLVPERSSWVTLTKAAQGVQVLARVASATSETVQIDAIVLDSTASGNGVISTPSLIVRYGQAGTLTSTRTVNGKEERLILGITANRESIPSTEKRKLDR